MNLIKEYRMIIMISPIVNWMYFLFAVSMALMTSCSSFAAAINLLVMLPWSRRFQSSSSVCYRRTLWLTFSWGSHWFTLNPLPPCVYHSSFFSPPTVSRKLS